MNVAPWVARHWLEVWYGVRNTGGYGNTAEQARSHARFWLGVAKAMR